MDMRSNSLLALASVLLYLGGTRALIFLRLSQGQSVSEPRQVFARVEMGLAIGFLVMGIVALITAIKGK